MPVLLQAVKFLIYFVECSKKLLNGASVLFIKIL